MSITEFFKKVERTAELGSWSDADKVTVAMLKLSAAAALFLNSNDEDTRDDITFDILRVTFTERFRIKHLDQFQCTPECHAV